MSRAEQYLSEALEAFDFGGELVGAVRYGHGHINDTFVVHTQPGEDPCRRFILQRISSAAFKHPEQVMSNIVGVTRYLGGKIAAAGGDPERETMSVWAARDGGSYFTDSEGSAWRCYPFIEGTVCLQRADTPELFAASGYAFGRFQRQLDGYHGEQKQIDSVACQPIDQRKDEDTHHHRNRRLPDTQAYPSEKQRQEQHKGHRQGIVYPSKHHHLRRQREKSIQFDMCIVHHPTEQPRTDPPRQEQDNNQQTYP